MRFFSHTALFLAAVTGVCLANDQEDDEHYNNPCKSYGIDFQDKGSYFQNISSTEPFTFVSTFEGCQPDYANNILVDPVGDQHLCSDTALTPDDKFQMSTCDLDKNELWSGEWSVVIISNNGDADPIAYMRDFSLSVGVPATTIYIPTATITATITPVVNSTSTSWETNIITSTKVVTSPSLTRTKTITSTPKRVTTTKTKIVGTITKHKYKVEPTVITKTKTKTCSLPRRQPHRDPWCTITPTLVHAAALETPTASTSSKKSGAHRREDIVRRIPADLAERLAERKARLQEAEVLEKRGLDNATATITETDTSKFSTSTVSVTTTTSTLIIPTVLTKVTTTTSTSTTYKGITKPIVTKTAPTPTKTKTKYTVIRTTSTITRRPTITITTKWAPASSTAICKAKGGKLV
ncbi:hypothetical protein Q7P37_007905 [Cladosporium fusiforme]